MTNPYESGPFGADPMPPLPDKSAEHLRSLANYGYAHCPSETEADIRTALRYCAAVIEGRSVPDAGDDAALLPCPFCGSPAAMECNDGATARHDLFGVFCTDVANTDCYASDRWYSSSSEIAAAHAWNTRAAVKERAALASETER